MDTRCDVPVTNRFVPSLLTALPFTTDAPKTSGGLR